MDELEAKRRVLKGCLFFTALFLAAMLISNYLSYLSVRHKIYMRSLRYRERWERALKTHPFNWRPDPNFRE